MDLSGKINIPSLGGAQYFIVCKDDASSFRHVAFLKMKSEANQCLQKLITWLETQTGNKVKKVRSDNALELTNQAMGEFYASKGIIHETTAPYTPESNGKAERDMRVIKESARTMLKASKLPDFMWAEAVH